MIKLLSIVMPYYNRRKLLLSTLRSIDHFVGEHPIETIIVDDNSDEDQTINDVGSMFPNLNINLIVLKRDNPKWRGAQVAYNTGFNAAKGDAILLNCPECLHAGDIVDYVYRHLEEKSYLSFSTFDGNEQQNAVLEHVDWNDPWLVYSTVFPCLFDPLYWLSRLINHTFIPYCAAINKEDMELLSGYDERFSKGIGYDDYDFVSRVRNLGLDMSLVDSPFCIHQWHPKPEYTNTINLDFLTSLERGYPKRIKAEHNTAYNK